MTAVGEVDSDATSRTAGITDDAVHRHRPRDIGTARVDVLRNLRPQRGQPVTQQPGRLQNEPVWTTLSVGTYNGYIRNGRTGARRLDLPLVSHGGAADRPDPAPGLISNEHNTDAARLRPALFQAGGRSHPAVRHAAEILNLPTVTATAPVALFGAGKILNYAPGIPPRPGRRSAVTKQPVRLAASYR